MVFPVTNGLPATIFPIDNKILSFSSGICWDEYLSILSEKVDGRSGRTPVGGALFIGKSIFFVVGGFSVVRSRLRGCSSSSDSVDWEI